jgi:hypothetical protein
VLQDLRSCSARLPMRSALEPLLDEKARSIEVGVALSEAAAGLLNAAGVEVPKEADARFLTVKKTLQARQTETFPLRDLGIRELQLLAAL